ncbi:sugar transferase [Sphingomonas sp. Leaf343]|uniref:sugar transferase n=1 Tax=Sphingomonas sp. Leaf343 TaxID=1736345 RepID=UPI00191C3EC1|nr:sugar transferase [Sphingomonas sp. Leaf343]
MAIQQVELRMIRLLDIVVSAAMLVFLFPLLLLVSAAVFIADPGPVIFKQRRLGWGGNTFFCLKFRSMALDADKRLAALLLNNPTARAEWERDHKLKDDPRVTSIGRILRKSSIDELPQLWNVLRGDMTLVGPRPIVEAEIVRYGRYFQDYCRVQPGLTGLWQISGRSATSYRRRVALDVIYVRSKSFKLNLKILSMTIPSVLLLSGAY